MLLSPQNWNAPEETGKAVKYYDKCLNFLSDDRIGRDIREYLAEAYIKTLHDSFGEKKISRLGRCLRFRVELYGVNHLKVAEAYFKLGEAYEKERDHEKQIGFFKMALDILEKLPRHEACHNLSAEVLYELGRALGNSGNRDQEIEYQLKALTFSKQNEKGFNLWTPRILFRLGDAYLFLKNKKEALACYEEMVAIQRKRRLEKKIDYIVMIEEGLLKLGNVYKDLNLTDKAVALFKEGIKEGLQERSLDEVGLFEIIRMYEKLGDIFYELGDMKRAIEHYKKQLECYNHKKLKCDQDKLINTVSILESLYGLDKGRTYNRLRCAYEKEGMSEETNECYLKASSAIETAISLNRALLPKSAFGRFS